MTKIQAGLSNLRTNMDERMRSSFVEFVEITSQQMHVSCSSLLRKFTAFKKWTLDPSCLMGTSVIGIHVVVSMTKVLRKVLRAKLPLT